jgi:deoxyadenosine/deoxycytidine kinase
MYVFISGNIGAGKSTVIEAFTTHCSTQHTWTFVEEPAETWAANGLLGAMYSGELSPGEFQLMALATRVASLTPTAAAGNVMAERSPFEDKDIFAASTLGEMQRVNYNFAFTRLMGALNLPPAEIVHFILEVRPEVAMERVKTRNRSGEQDVTVEYLRKLDDAYQTFAPPGTIHRINANGTTNATLAAIADVCNTFST